MREPAKKAGGLPGTGNREPGRPRNGGGGRDWELPFFAPEGAADL